MTSKFDNLEKYNGITRGVSSVEIAKSFKQSFFTHVN